MAGKKAAAALEQGQGELPHISPEAYEKMTEYLREMREDWFGGVCKGDNVSLDGVPNAKGHTACHAWIGGQPYDKPPFSPEDDFVVLTCHSKKHNTASPEAHEAIILWMASDDSPFGRFIVNREDKESLTNDGAIIHCGPSSINRDVCMWICKVLRYATEGSKALDTWHTLYKGGVNPLLALLIASEVSTLKGAVFGAGQVTAHVNVFTRPVYNDGGNTRVNARRIAQGDWDPKANQTNYVFGREKGVAWYKVFADFTKPFVKDDGWGGQIKGNGATEDQLIAKALEWQKSLGVDAKPRFPLPLSEAPKIAKKLPTKTTVYLECDL